MYFTRIFLSIVFVVFASTALAAKPAKDLVCHVGNEFGPNGEVYDPDCEPTSEYDCSADAGKIDLIAAPKKANHVGNEAHYFDDGDFEWVDFYPEEGVGDDPLDFEEGGVPGIDRGCELVTCPCAADVGAASDAWRAAILRLQARGGYNACVVDPESGIESHRKVIETVGFPATVDSIVGTATSPWIPYTSYCLANPGGYVLPDYVGYSSDAQTSRRQHNACVRIIDEALGKPNYGPLDCTL